jgi:predicted Zn-dependent peptidase
MWKIILSILLLFIFISISTYSEAGDTMIHKHIFPNGLTLIHKENKSNQIVALDLFVKNGRIYEPDEKAGLSSFLQTLLPKGTKKHNAEQIAEIIESIGASFGTDASEDYSEIYAVSTVKHFFTIFDLVYEIYTEPVFPEKEIEKERQATLAGIKAREEDIFTVTYDYFSENLYNKHPYALPVIGTEETVKKFTREDLVNQHKKFYTPERTILVIVGNLPWEKVKKMVEENFGKLSAGEKISESLFPEVTLQQPIEKTYQKKFKQAYLMLGYPTPEVSHTDYSVLKVVNTILGGGMRGRLFQELRDKYSLAYEISSFYPTRKLTSRFVIYLGLDKNKITQAKERILEQLKRLKDEPAEKKELEEVKKFLRGNYLIEHAKNKQQSWYLGWWELMGKGYEYDELYPKDLSQITAQQIQTLAHKYFTENYLVIVIQPGN